MVEYEVPVSRLAKDYLWQNADMTFVNPDFFEKFSPYCSNLFMEGNPKFDYIYEKLSCKDVPEEWKAKIDGRKVVMWATTHGIYNRKMSALYTFDVWARDIIFYFMKHKEYVLLFRPTVSLFQDLIRNDVCTYIECKRFEEIFEREDNFILDWTNDYGAAYCISDALLCPPNGMLLSYLPTKKPIVYTTTHRMNYSFTDEKLIEYYYTVKNKSELEQAIDQIFHHGDPLYEKRMQTLKRYVPRFDGKIGERIMQRVMGLK